jgi:hypothetical protein
VRTPRFDNSSAGFAFSERFFSVSSATRPVHTSLVTGLYPFEHGIQGQQDQRVRQGAPRLFRQCTARGMDVAIFSEAPTIFTGLDLGVPVGLLETAANCGLRQIRHWLGATQKTGRNRCLLLHYWSAHTPYGAADGSALGETADLLRQGNVEEVRRRYGRAVEHTFENKIAPILEELDLARWGVLLFGDHGESWTPDEFYHGTSVHNRVLRVPLYLHAPYTGNQSPDNGGVISLIDLYATACGMLGLPREDDGFGVDLLHPAQPEPGITSAYRMAEIRPGRDAGDDRVILDSVQSLASPVAVRWCVFDAEYRLYGEGDEWQIERQWTEQPDGDTPSAAAAAYLAVREAFQAGSKWVRRPLEEGTTSADDEALRQRLQGLGYL